MYVSSNGPEDEDAIRMPLLLARLQRGLEDLDGLLHNRRCVNQLDDEHLLACELLAHLADSLREAVLNSINWAYASRNRLSRGCSVSESSFVIELFFSALGCFFRSVELDESFLNLCSSNHLTEGSSFGEASKNDLGVNGGHVKKKMKKPVIATAKNVEIDLTVEKISREWLEWSTGKFPFLAKRMTQEKFYSALMKTKKTLEMTSEQIEAMYRWIKKDSFWSEHAISPSSLLTDSRNGIKKIDNILSQMRNQIVRENPFIDFDENWQNPFD